MTRDYAHVDYGALKRRHYGSTYNCHYKEGCTKRGVLALYVLQGYAIDGGEHKRHEGGDAYQAIETWHSYNKNCSQSTSHGANSEDGQQST